ncbi:hypothetical protein [Paenibacillus baekrokdamisoli]|uniref:hypothetical protein n=1 Tax=Paenibacillus baekrokdamisoli TaxID=1712516 RepID=UPI001C860229|nr:hypothetical protein [Paenibacillus baekrokdamisoli]
MTKVIRCTWFDRRRVTKHHTPGVACGAEKADRRALILVQSLHAAGLKDREDAILHKSSEISCILVDSGTCVR